MVRETWTDAALPCVQPICTLAIVTQEGFSVVYLVRATTTIDLKHLAVTCSFVVLSIVKIRGHYEGVSGGVQQKSSSVQSNRLNIIPIQYVCENCNRMSYVI